MSALKLSDYYWLVKFFPQKKMRNISPSLSGVLLDVGIADNPYTDIFGSYVSRYIALDILWNTAIDVQADAVHLPFQNGSIDVVLCVDALYFIPEPWKAFSEFERVLKPGGRLVVFASQSWRTMDEKTDYYRFTKNGLSYLAQRAGLQVIESKPLDGFWAKMGAQVNYYLFRIQKKSVLWSFLFRAVYACNNAFFYFLNKINNIETDTINNSLIAVKRNVTEGSDRSL